ncbi:MAG TPA: hypothetical protein VK559_04280 [Ferruginibacter sp.]|nr:hypothetical protein [Ferruginibacter sp.]
MKRSVLLIATIFVVCATIIFSCVKTNVPAPAGSCINITRSSAAGTDSQMVVVNDPITPITYAVTANISTDTSATDTIHVSVFGSLPTGVTASFSGGVLVISGTPTTGIGSPFTYTVTTTGNSCSTTTIKGSIIVTTCATINLSSAAGTNAQNVTVNTAITPIQYTLGGGGTGATAAGMPTGVTGSFSGGVYTITGTPTVISATPYSYTVTTVGGACTSTATGTIKVNAVTCATIGLTSAAGTNAQTVTVNTAITPIQYTTAGGVTNATAAGLPTGVTGAFSGSLFTLTGTPTIVSATPYTYTVTTVGGACTPTATGTIKVNAATGLSTCATATVSYAGPYCLNTSAAEPPTLLGTTGGTYTASPAGLTISGASGAVTPSTSTTGTYTVSYTIAGTPNCVSQTRVIISPIPAAIISYAGPYSSTNAVAQAVTLTGTHGGTFSSSAGLTINAVTGAVTPSTSTIGTYTVTYTIAAAGGCSVQTAQTTVTIE